ncbi:Carboxylesterase family-domain-containing protein [Mycena epipterygia]|nr:Carboxylesterase family-domain-containing protein [Mycena epipterygia]
MGQAISYTTTSVDIDLQDAGTLRDATISSPAGVCCNRFLGVPYALPPVGEHRWRHPRPLPSNFSYSAPDGSPRDSPASAICASSRLYGGRQGHRAQRHRYRQRRLSAAQYLGPVWREAESWLAHICLTSRIGNPCHDEALNPVERIAPVSTGGDGVRAIFVAVGYRVSVLGFLAGQVLDSEGNKGGNYGTWDQRCALEWVHKNIHYFGGNNRLITLGGQSAGAYSAHAQLFHELLRAPKTEGGLFHNVVLYSNSIGVQPKQSGEVEVQYQLLLAACRIAATNPPSSQLSQLRAIPAATLVDKVNSLAQHTVRTVSDDDFFGADLLGSYNDGSFAAEFKRRGMNLLIGEML